MKRILGENFRDEEEPVSHILLYKSLWLEAEAQLRSLIYRARFELEKYSSKHGDNDSVQGEQSKTKADFELSSYQNSVNSVSNSHSPKHISALHGVNLTEPSGLKVSPNHSVDSFNIASQEYLSRSMDSHARDTALILALEGTESLKAQNPNETCASESLSLTDDKKPETRDSSDADVKESDLVLEDNQEIQLSSCQRFDNGLVTDDSDDLTSDWEVV
ncbi:uncharacterized protein LOC114746708 isoform X1 [Neltuma alba]|uniref:uncharacterized protein LOC114746708 isoform X1 n=1 Tax=Neltuma alba TaxID=207710 RepID=UPI0010A2CF6C|nr:uncharacterized protein LOC114746708 isoform X1 [Prosopis alba]